MTKLNRKYERALNALARPVPPTEVKHRRSSLRLPRKTGIQFRVISGRLRSCYQQFDGSFELAWEPFRVIPRIDCEIDEHKFTARRNQEEEVA